MTEASREPVSVVIPTYNRAHMVGDAINSVLEQCRADDEILVADDGSSDDTAATVQQFGPPVRYIFQENAGAGAARNNGISEARHDLIAFLDSDDLWQPGKLDRQVPLMTARRDLVMSFSDFAVHHNDGRISEWYLYSWHHDDRSWDEILGQSARLSDLTRQPFPEDGDPPVHIGSLYLAEMKASYVFTSTVIARRSVAGRRLWFADHLKMYEDWVCFGRLAGAGPVAFINAQLAVQRGHTEGRITDADAHVRARARVEVLRSVWGSDRKFLDKYFNYYSQLYDEQQVIVAAGLTSEGQNEAARKVLREVSNAPAGHRLLAWLPSPVSQMILAIRRRLRKLMGR